MAGSRLLVCASKPVVTSNSVSARSGLVTLGADDRVGKHTASLFDGQCSGNIANGCCRLGNTVGGPLNLQIRTCMPLLVSGPTRQSRRSGDLACIPDVAIQAVGLAIPSKSGKGEHKQLAGQLSCAHSTMVVCHPCRLGNAVSGAHVCRSESPSLPRQGHVHLAGCWDGRVGQGDCARLQDVATQAASLVIPSELGT